METTQINMFWNFTISIGAENKLFMQKWAWYFDQLLLPEDRNVQANEIARDKES